LSAGDKLVTFGTFTVNGIVNPQYRTITAAEIQAIDNPNAGLIPEISNAGIDHNAGDDVKFEQAGSIQVGNQQLPSYLDKPFEQHIISNQSQLDQLRTDLGLPPAHLGFGLPGTQLPNVDFSQQVLVYSVRDAADPNATQQNFKLNNEGTLTNTTVSTKIGFQPSDVAQIEFFALAREGIQQFATNDPITDKRPGVEIEPPVTTDPAILDTLNDNKQKWIDAGLTNYGFTLERSCFCTEDARRPVDNYFDNGTLNSVFHDGSQGEVPESNQLNVKDLFKIIDDAIDRNADEIRVAYDPERGFPTSIYVDYDQGLADEELSLTIRDLQTGLQPTDNTPEPPTTSINPETRFTPVSAGSQFTLEAPVGSKYVPQQGFDSFVGLIKSPDYSLQFDKGLYSGALRDNGNNTNYQSQDVMIDGKQAQLVTSFDPTPGAERPYFAGIHFPGEQTGFTASKFTMTTHLASADQYSEIDKVFRSIRF
jgi:hypothetical protein